MINWNLVDAGVIAWAMANGAILACIIGLCVYLAKSRKQRRLQRVKDAIANYESRMKLRGAVSALIDKI